MFYHFQNNHFSVFGCEKCPGKFDTYEEVNKNSIAKNIFVTKLSRTQPSAFKRNMIHANPLFFYGFTRVTTYDLSKGRQFMVQDL